MALTFLTSIQNALNEFLVNKAFLKELNWLPIKANPTKIANIESIIKSDRKNTKLLC